MDNKTPKLVCDFPKPLAVISMNLDSYISAKGFENLRFYSPCRVEKDGYFFFLVTLMLVHVSSKKMCL